MLIYEDHPQSAAWLKWLLIGVLALTLILGVVFLSVDIIASIVMFAVTLFDGILFYCIMPRSYQVYEDYIKINLGGPFKMKLDFKDISSISRVEGHKALASSNIRFATSTNYVVEITRKSKMGIEISPSNGEIFMEQVNQAWKRYTSISPR
jgi:hypothetical protein